MTQRTKPPFRADHVGSILRTAPVKQARAQREKGEITPAQLKAVEDREIEKIIKKQEEVGLQLATDGDGQPINDAMIEIWQADSQGRYAHARGNEPRPNAKFTGFGRSATDKSGVFSFDTVKPGAVAGPNGKPQAPHIVVCIFSRGMLRQVYTRLYFSDEAGNGADQILNLVPADRRGTLFAHKQPGEGVPLYRCLLYTSRCV